MNMVPGPHRQKIQRRFTSGSDRISDNPFQAKNPDSRSGLLTDLGRVLQLINGEMPRP